MRFFGLAALVGLSISLACSSTTTVNPAPVDAGSDVGSQDDAASDAPAEAAANMCSAAITSFINPIGKISTGAVTILNDAGGTKTLYIDATAGGFGNETTHPRVYVSLETGTRVDISDVQAQTSTAWDLAFRRPVIYTNSGDAGPGMGGEVTVHKPFDQATVADATGFSTESFVDADCNPKMDMTGDLLTTMSAWYDYNQATMVVTPVPNTTEVIRGGTGKLYKMGIVGYYGLPDAGMGTIGAVYIVQVAGL